MNAEEFLESLLRHGVSLRADADQIRFRAPRGVMTDELRADLAARKSDVLDLLRRRTSRITRYSAHEIPQVPRTGTLRPSLAQEHMWLLHELAPESPFYNVPARLHLEGELDISSLSWALRRLGERHEALRTEFPDRDGSPVQVIRDSARIELPPVRDLSALPDQERIEAALRLAEEEVRKPFDLATAPLARAVLLRLATTDHVLILTIHHIVFDGWSMGVLLRDLAELYHSHRHGTPPSLPELRVAPADFAVWQRAQLQGHVLEGHLDYWRRRLADLPTLELPTDRPRPPTPGFRGSREWRTLPKPLSQKVRAFSRREHVTLFMTTLTAFAILLRRYTNQDDVVVGSPVANRRHHEIEGAIGYFANSLVMRTDLSGNPTFLELLQQVRRTALDAYAHQDLPFGRLVDELDPERNPGVNPLFQVLFAVQNDPAPTRETDGVRLSLDWVETLASRFDLEWHIWDESSSLRIACVHDTDLFDTTTIHRMLRHYEHLLQEAVTHPQRRLAELPVLSDAERAQLLVHWNATRIDRPADLTVVKLLEEQVERQPETTALVHDGEKLTYTELNRRANRLAHHLIALRVGPEAAVGLCLRRGIDMVIGVLGTLKAGGACVPLDPDYPLERRSYMISNSRLSVLLTQSDLVATLPDTDARLLCLDSERPRIAAASDANPRRGIDEKTLAYVLYTSGSTGRPKGVAMEHGPLANLIQWHLESSRHGLPARTLQYTSLNFDVSFQEIFSTLCSGGTLILIDEFTRHDPQLLLRFLAEKRIERLFLPFVALQQLAEAAEDEQAVELREVITAGERLRITPAVAKLCRRSGCSLHNHYGPTESHVVTAYTLSGPVDEWPEMPPIGRPIDNARIYVLDSFNQPVPPGVTGELHIGGRCLARGYRELPELTDERFIADPFSREEGARLYRTGDLARYRIDGNLEFLGRRDSQVKIRGFRIEPGEIESALGEHGGVSQVAVIAREDQPGDPRLVAYVVPGDGKELDSAELREHLRQRLPAYMLPSAYVILNELPLNPNGKIDRDALPVPERDNGGAYAAPGTSTEQRLATIWGEVLELERIGTDENFFEIGGHSLLATRVVSLIRRRFRVDVALAQLFERPTVAQLASLLDELLLAKVAKMSEQDAAAFLSTLIESDAAFDAAAEESARSDETKPNGEQAQGGRQGPDGQ